MPPAEPVLIVALSGRALAQSARAAGYAPIVLDAFGDLDTRAVAERWQRLPVDRHWRFPRTALLAAAGRLAPPPVPLVWGSGFERATRLLTRLAHGRTLWGTTPAAVRAVKDPLGFARTAAALGIDHPETRTSAPPSSRGWLLKRAGAAGGGHVQRAGGALPADAGWYWQRRVPGKPVSALVLAAGGRARVIGISEQWSAPNGGRAFRFGGAAAPATLRPGARERLAAAAEALACHYAVRGIASVDALVAGDRVVVLELNPRPGASLDAYEHAYGVNLFQLHRSACAGCLAEAPTALGAAGSAIVRPPAALRIPARFDWPSWTADRTPCGTAVRAQDPVCTVVAEDRTVPEVRARLAARAAALLGMLAGDAAAIRPAAPRRSSAESPNLDAARATARAGIDR
jgi:predicted ATP-grasp superfamily ATP-dependent carboligase